MTGADKTKLDGIAAGAQVNTVGSVNGQTGAVVLTAADVGALTQQGANSLYVELVGDTMTGRLNLPNAGAKFVTIGYAQVLGGNADEFHLYRGASDNEAVALLPGSAALRTAAKRFSINNTSGYFFDGVVTTTTGQGSAAFEWTGSNHTLRVFTSSRRFKQDIQDSPYGLADIAKLRSVTFRGIQEHDENITSVGLIAEEVADAGLDILVQRQGDEISGVNYNHIISMLVKSVQELAAEVAALKAAK